MSSNTMRLCAIALPATLIAFVGLSAAYANIAADSMPELEIYARTVALTVGLMLLGFVAATTVVTEVDMSGNGPRPDGDAVLSFARWAFEGAVLLPLKFIVAFEVVVPLLLFCLTDTLPLAFGLVRAIVG